MAFFVFSWDMVSSFNTRGWVYDAAVNLGLVPIKENFTELYFKNYSELPKTIESIKIGDEVSFSFSIHNMEGKEMDYPYVIYVKNSTDEKTIIEEKTLRLKDGEEMSVDQTYTFLAEHDSVEKLKVHVELVNLNQEIHFSLFSN